MDLAAAKTQLEARLFATDKLVREKAAEIERLSLAEQQLHVVKHDKAQLVGRLAVLESTQNQLQQTLLEAQSLGARIHDLEQNIRELC